MSAITRDMIQGFVSGYKDAGGDMAELPRFILRWLQANSAYPTTEDEQKNIVGDLRSYDQ